MRNIPLLMGSAWCQFAASEGASLGLMANSLNILDQLGMIDNINRYNVRCKVWGIAM